MDEHCCRYIPDVEPTDEELERLRVNHQPFCEENKGIHFHVGHLNVNQRSLDNEAPMLHCYTVVFDEHQVNIVIVLNTPF